MLSEYKCMCVCVQGVFTFSSISQCYAAGNNKEVHLLQHTALAFAFVGCLLFISCLAHKTCACVRSIFFRR